MAVGGALRAAIRAGRFGVAGRESRRQARALASLNQGGPLGSRTGSPFPFPGPERGFDPARVAGQAFGESPRGAAVVVDSNTGRRVVLPQSFDDFIEGAPMTRGPIEAPYEGVRGIPGSYVTSDLLKGPFMGRGGAIPAAFGGPTLPSPMFRGAPSRPRFFFDDPESGSLTAGLMGRIDSDPYFGFRTVRGFPFD